LSLPTNKCKGKSTIKDDGHICIVWILYIETVI